MILDLYEKEFQSRYGFNLKELYYSYIIRILNKKMLYKNVKNIAYDIANSILNKIDKKETIKDVLYKQKEKNFFRNRIIVYSIAIKYKDIYFVFEIKDKNNMLKVKRWYLKNETEIENDKKYINIEKFINKNEEKYEK